jgi:adenine phosphoribosyltransferase
MSSLEQALSLIRFIPDYPSPGILFQDITPLLADGPALSCVIGALRDKAKPELRIVGVEARGFILGSALAHSVGVGFIPIRKKGKLPYQTLSRSYGLEYGTDEIEVHSDAFLPGEQVILIDDILATGGTVIASIDLIKAAGADVVQILLLSEIPELGARELILSKYPTVEIDTLVGT